MQTNQTPVESSLDQSDLDQVVYLGLTRRQLEAAFNRVAPKENWKFPIDTTFKASDVTIAELNAISASIVFYTGGNAKIVRKAGTVQVTAPGYFASVGA